MSGRTIFWRDVCPEKYFYHDHYVAEALWWGNLRIAPGNG